MRRPLKSPAKINLLLNVLYKRKDGYHQLRTVFERVSLCDEICLEPLRRGIRIQTNVKNIPTGPKNIAYRAAKLLRDRFGISRGVRIRIQKKIPVAAGLGGGSSNAATVLVGLNRLWRLGLSKRELMKLGASLGSDVAFFILDTPFALASGRGEILRKIAGPGRKLWHCLVKPRFSISTRSAYECLDQVLSRRKPQKPSSLTVQNEGVRMLCRSLKAGDSKRLPDLLQNTLELTLNKRVAEISCIKKKLKSAGALAALMSGSGSSVFGIFSSKNSASRAARVLKKDKSLQVFVVSTF
jgi:4-diphosphocytidyl-2-C-methyl-D-erythritol kinase